jgi:hypothetical protein
MSKGMPGADSSAPVTHQIGGRTLIQLASETFGTVPVLWGRYFSSVTAGGTVEYRHHRENQILRDNGIRVLPIARQTKRVDGSEANGIVDARRNVEDLIATFGGEYLAGQGGRFFMFLDVEGTPALSVEYYTGWAQTLAAHSRDVTGGAVVVLPCVYATRSDLVTWNVLVDADNLGVACHGAWVARWRHHGCLPLIDWDPSIVQPAVALPCEVLLWQYADDCNEGNGFDCNETNPQLHLEDELLRQLILPPPPA